MIKIYVERAWFINRPWIKCASKKPTKKQTNFQLVTKWKIFFIRLQSKVEVCVFRVDWLTFERSASLCCYARNLIDFLSICIVLIPNSRVPQQGKHFLNYNPQRIVGSSKEHWNKSSTNWKSNLQVEETTCHRQFVLHIYPLRIFFPTIMVTTWALANLRMREQSGKTTVPLDPVPERHT